MTGPLVSTWPSAVSFTSEALLANFKTLMDAVIKARPAAARGQYLRKIAISSTMGPGVRLDPQLVVSAVAERDD